MRRDVPSDGLARLAYAGLARVADLLAALAFWAAVAFPALYFAVHLHHGLADLSAPALTAMVAANAVAVAVGHRHGTDAEGRRERRDEGPTDAPAVAPARGD